MAETGSGEIDEPSARLEQQDQRLTALEALVRSAPSRRRWDSYAAVIASLIGLLALAVSGYTAYVQRAQLRAQVWPHLRLFTSDTRLGVYVTNQGTGPARITAARVAVDDAPVKRWRDAMKATGLPSQEWTMSTLDRTVLPPGKDFAMLEAMDSDESRATIKALLRGKHRLSVMVCYCSVLDECWFTEMPGNREGTPIDQCPIAAAERFTD